MLYLNYIFCGLLGLSGLGHLVGTFKFTERGSGLFVWSLSGVLAAFLLVAFNLMHSWHPDDLFITLVSLLGNLSWITIVYLFGRSIRNVKDPRVLMHMIAALGLAALRCADLLN